MALIFRAETEFGLRNHTRKLRVVRNPDPPEIDTFTPIHEAIEPEYISAPELDVNGHNFMSRLGRSVAYTLATVIAEHHPEHATTRARNIPEKRARQIGTATALGTLIALRIFTTKICA